MDRLAVNVTEHSVERAARHLAPVDHVEVGIVFHDVREPAEPLALGQAPEFFPVDLGHDLGGHVRELRRWLDGLGHLSHALSN